jgi:predicted secreted Zn-dependent protease
MAAHHQDLSRAAWRKSTYSGQDGNCVEIATNLPGIIAVRDSKNPDGPALSFTHSNWAAFIQGIKTGERAATWVSLSRR